MASYMPSLPSLGQPKQQQNPYKMLADHYSRVYGQPTAPTGATSQTGGATGKYVPQTGANTGVPQAAQNTEPRGYRLGNQWINTGPGAGNVLYPMRVPGTDWSKSYLPMQFPGQIGPNTWANPGGVGAGRPMYVDYTSLAWQKAMALHYDSTSPEGAAWNAMPDPEKADLAGWEPQFRDAYLYAMGTGNTGQALKVQQQWADYKRQATQQEQYQAQQAAQVQTPRQASPYVR